MPNFLISLEPPNVYVDGKLIGYISNIRMQDSGRDSDSFNAELAVNPDTLYQTDRCFKTMDLIVEKIQEELPPAIHKLLQPPKIKARPDDPTDHYPLNLNI